MSSEVRNAASDRWRRISPLFSDREFVQTSARDLFADSFVRDDRQRLIGLPQADADEFLAVFDSWFMIEGGNPTFTVVEIIAVRGERLALGRLRGEYEGSAAGESLWIVQFDDRVELAERVVAFDLDDLDAAMAELDAMHAVLTA